MNDSATPSGETTHRDFGRPDVEFRPTFGQTAAGVLIFGSSAAACFAYALFATESDALQRFVMGSCGVTGLGMTYWMYSLQKWRLSICPRGVIQRGAWSVDEIAWADVREAVVERHYFTRNPDNVTLVRNGAGGNVTVRPINCGQWKQAVAAVLAAVSDRHIPVRTVRVWTD